MKSLTTSDKIWTEDIGAGPVLATAIHDAHDVRPEVARHLVPTEAVRLREQDLQKQADEIRAKIEQAQS